MIPSSAGTYIVLMILHQAEEIRIRSGRVWQLEAGAYGYVGSAHGPGGLRARVRRHCSDPKRKHWHIDYLAPRAEVLGALVVESDRRLECDWAAWFHAHADACIHGFGSSDCSCPGHLFHLGPRSISNSIIELAVSHLGTTFFPPFSKS